jgi:hypothetical protein
MPVISLNLHNFNYTFICTSCYNTRKIFVFSVWSCRSLHMELQCCCWLSFSRGSINFSEIHRMLKSLVKYISMYDMVGLECYKYCQSYTTCSHKRLHVLYPHFHQSKLMGNLFLCTTWCTFFTFLSVQLHDKQPVGTPTYNHLLYSVLRFTS